jgi:hypothetical protein
MTEAKRSRGIAVLAWLMLVFSAASLLGLDVRVFFALYKFLPQGVVLLLYGYGVLAVTLGIIASIGILRSKEIMRKVAVAVNALDFLVGLPFFLFLPSVRQSFYDIAESVIRGRATPFLSVEGLARAEFYSAVSGALAAMILNIIFIYYFTRPKVKEQFK